MALAERLKRTFVLSSGLDVRCWAFGVFLTNRTTPNAERPTPNIEVKKMAEGWDSNPRDEVAFAERLNRIFVLSSGLDVRCWAFGVFS